MKNYALIIEYHGKNYSGWQRQSHVISVQGCLEKALSSIANAPVEVVCAGRTDAGVHATAQVVSFKTHALRDINAWYMGVNSLLPKDIKVIDVYEVDENFHARFSAVYRRYNYVIYQQKGNSALWDEHSTWVPFALDIKAMNEACYALLGEQDFSAFRSSQCQSHSVYRNIHHACFTQFGQFIIFDIQGNAFLHHMVRNIVGSMLEIGQHIKPVDWIKTLLQGKDRTQAGKTAPAQGLYLVEINYPDKFGVKAKRQWREFFQP
ncbi:tRNA pseudouridine(38-40) synthase TruA [Facilibium subflavum]|uniref:tRNA pseudouridine(38-40) synthase TruA n=1 Tax=Facilibium subflavum TaxID=2219058 RepID=UPI000E6473A7|nr:tRNA pseudouridine(38-40) synthase TruA [Facilibium subflavum]